LEIGNHAQINLLKKYGAKPGLYDTPITNSEQSIQLGQKSSHYADTSVGYDIERFIDMSICVPAVEGSELIGRGGRHELVIFKPKDNMRFKPYLRVEVPTNVYVDRVVCLTKSREVSIAHTPLSPLSGALSSEDSSSVDSSSVDSSSVDDNSDFPQDEKLMALYSYEYGKTGFCLGPSPRSWLSESTTRQFQWNIKNSEVPRVHTNIVRVAAWDSSKPLFKEIILYSRLTTNDFENWVYGARLEVYGHPRETEKGGQTERKSIPFSNTLVVGSPAESEKKESDQNSSSDASALPARMSFRRRMSFSRRMSGGQEAREARRVWR
jgi:hypothetical protein